MFDGVWDTPMNETKFTQDTRKKSSLAVIGTSI